jgi:hypothetical protein
MGGPGGAAPVFADRLIKIRLKQTEPLAFGRWQV